MVGGAVHDKSTLVVIRANTEHDLDVVAAGQGSAEQPSCVTFYSEQPSVPGERGSRTVSLNEARLKAALEEPMSQHGAAGSPKSSTSPMEVSMSLPTSPTTKPKRRGASAETTEEAPEEAAPTTPPQPLGAADHVQALRAAVQEECQQHRRRMDDLASQHLRTQQELFDRCLERITSSTGQDRGGAALAEQGAPRARLELEVQGAPVARPSSRKPSLTLNTWLANDGSVGMQAQMASLQRAVQRVEDMVSSSGQADGANGRRRPAQGDARKILSSGTLQFTRSNSPLSTGDESNNAWDSEQPESPYSLGKGRAKNYEALKRSTQALKARQGNNIVRDTLARRCSRCFEWWTTLEEPVRKGRLASMVTSKKFETLCAWVIIINAGMSCISINHQIESMSAEPLPAIEIAEHLFITFYALELLSKLMVHRLYYFCNEDLRWNIFDFILVSFSLFDLILTLAFAGQGDEGGGADFTFMRTLRILRMARVLRGLRVMKFFIELRLMLNSLIGSVASLFWSIAMLLLIFYIFALVFVQGVANFFIDMVDAGKEIDSRYNKLRYLFGSVEKAILSLYKASTGGDDWHVFLEQMEMVGPMYAFVFIFFIAFSQIALLNILTAIFVQRAMKLAQPDRETMAIQIRNEEMAAFEEMRRIMHEADVNVNGTISAKEFCEQVQYGKLGAQLAVVGLDVKDAHNFFNLILAMGTMEPGHQNYSRNIKGDPEVPIDSFVEQCMRMRGTASSIDLHKMQLDIDQIVHTHRHLRNDLLVLLSEPDPAEEGAPQTARVEDPIPSRKQERPPQDELGPELQQDQAPSDKSRKTDKTDFSKESI